jgi:hypothetical protein
MKTKSLKSLAALLGAVVALNVSVLAGPGPQPQPVSHKVTTVAVFAKGTTVKPEAQSSSKLVTITGAHGTTYGFRR